MFLYLKLSNKANPHTLVLTLKVQWKFSCGYVVNGQRKPLYEVPDLALVSMRKDQVLVVSIRGGVIQAVAMHVANLP